MAESEGEPGPKRRLFIGLIVLIFIEFGIVSLFFLIVPSSRESENFLTILPMELAGFMHVFAWSNSVDYTFVDIDDATFSEWRTSGHTDRRKIKELISRIVSDKYNKPKALVVDIDLSASISEKSSTDGKSNPYVEKCPQDG